MSDLLLNTSDNRVNGDTLTIQRGANFLDPNIGQAKAIVITGVATTAGVPRSGASPPACVDAAHSSRGKRIRATRVRGMAAS